MLIFDHVHYSPIHSYMYIDTPKVACSTIKYTLQRFERRNRDVVQPNATVPVQYGYSELLLRIHDRRQSLLKYPTDLYHFEKFVKRSRHVFCFVRNPFSRILSVYLDKIIGNFQRNQMFLKHLHYTNSDKNCNITFIEFLSLVKRQIPHEMDPHWRPQYLHVLSGVPYSFVGSFEKIYDDLYAILSAIDPELPKYILTVDEHKTQASSMTVIQKYYADERAVQLVQEIYSEDFNRFGYPSSVWAATEPPRIRGWNPDLAVSCEF